MFPNILVARGRACAIALLIAIGTAAPSAQYGRPTAGGKSSLKGQLIKTGLYMFSGETNTLLRLSGKGAIIVDGQAPGNYDALMAQVRAIAEHPVRLLINTDHHQEHAGSNARFAADGAQILAHENAAKHRAAPPSAGNMTSITKTFGRDITVPIGGIEVQVMHFGKAHTDGDSVVYFPNLKVVAVGDLFSAPPDPDYAAGGSLVGWGPVLTEILKLDFDVLVPGRGPTVSRADVVAYKTKVETLVTRGIALVKKGVAKEQLMSQLKAHDLGWTLTFTGARLDRFYAELSRPH